MPRLIQSTQQVALAEIRPVRRLVLFKAAVLALSIFLMANRVQMQWEESVVHSYTPMPFDGVVLVRNFASKIG